MFLLKEDMFDGILNLVRSVVESEAVAMAGCPQSWRSIDEKERTIDAMFLAEFHEKHLRQNLCSRRIKESVEQTVSRGSTAEYSQ